VTGQAHSPTRQPVMVGWTGSGVGNQALWLTRKAANQAIFNSLNSVTLPDILWAGLKIPSGGMLMFDVCSAGRDKST